MNPSEVIQGTDAWRAARCGYVTASRIDDVLRKPRRGQKESTTRKAYMAQIVAERLTGKPFESEFESFDTRRGLQIEPFARTEYEIRTGYDVITVGSIPHPTIPMASASPDGLIGADGMCQIKCPRTHVHLEYLQNGIVPVEYRPQMLFELACTGRKWNDFVSHERNFPDHLQLFVVRLHRNEAEIEEIEAQVVKFLSEVDEVLARLPKADNPGKSTVEQQLEASLGITQHDVEAR